MRESNLKFECPDGMTPDGIESLLVSHLKKDASGVKYYMPRKLRNETKANLIVDNDRFHSFDKLAESKVGASCIVAFPGPSLGDFDSSILRDKKVLSFAANVAALALKATYCVVAEAPHARWLCRNKLVVESADYILTGRAALTFKLDRQSKVFNEAFVTRWEEGRIVPLFPSAPVAVNTLMTAFQMGCSRAYLVGLDLSREHGFYVKDTPYDSRGTRRTFSGQVSALQQFKLPGFEVINCSPVSKDLLPFEYLPYEKLQDAI